VNLLDNAVKFTTTGSVIVTAALESETEEAARIAIAVADTGTGIPAGRQASIFQPFRSGDESDGHLMSAGLGLAICARLVEAMGGSMEVDSQIGAGSTFRFVATFGRPARRTETSKPLRSRSKRRLSVLTVDDNPGNRQFLTKLLESAGHQVTPVADGMEAVRVFSNDLFDLILVDVAMPELDGFETTRAIRACEQDGYRAAIYALNADRNEDAERCLDAGMDGLLTKPLQVNQLLEIVSRTAAASQD
jgi:CheY-like chemotaxis protein